MAQQVISYVFSKLAYVNSMFTSCFSFKIIMQGVSNLHFDEPGIPFLHISYAFLLRISCFQYPYIIQPAKCGLNTHPPFSKKLLPCKMR